MASTSNKDGTIYSKNDDRLSTKAIFVLQQNIVKELTRRSIVPIVYESDTLILKDLYNNIVSNINKITTSFGLTNKDSSIVLNNDDYTKVYESIEKLKNEDLTIIVKGFCDSGCISTCYTTCNTVCRNGCTQTCGFNCSKTCGGCQSTCTGCQSTCSGTCIQFCRSISRVTST